MAKVSKEITYQAGYKYQLYTPYTHNIDIGNTEGFDNRFFTWTGNYLTIKAGYAWDGPSGLTFDTNTFMRGSLVHDAMYQLMRMGEMGSFYRKDADDILREICLQDGMWSFRAWYVWKAVRSCGEDSATNGKEVMVAP